MLGYMDNKSAGEQIDDIIAGTSGWRGETLAQLRAIIAAADPACIEEIKWRKPSRPQGVPVWSHDGTLCVADILKNAVRLTFPKGARIPDPARLFNARLDSKSVRALDVSEGMAVDTAALQVIILAAVRLNTEPKELPQPAK